MYLDISRREECPTLNELQIFRHIPKLWPLTARESKHDTLCDVRAALARPSLTANKQNQTLHINYLSQNSSVTYLVVQKKCKALTLKIAPYLAVDRVHIYGLSGRVVSIAAEPGSTPTSRRSESERWRCRAAAAAHAEA